MPLTAEDKIEIHELLADYSHAIDHGRHADIPAMFTDDCVIDFGALMGRHEGQAGARQFADMLAKTPVRMRHYVTNVRVTGDGDTAHAESYVLAMVGDPGTLSPTTGHYEDDFRKVNGRWKLRARRAVIELPGA
jgi:ketosteroid isomerase-like protein